MPDDLPPVREEFALRLSTTKGGEFVVRWEGKKVSSEAPFAESIVKIWKEVLPTSKEPKKVRQLYRLAQLAVGIEQAQRSGQPLTEEAIRTLESTKKTTVTAALALISDENGKVDFDKIGEEIAEKGKAVGKKSLSAKEREISHLVHISALLREAVHIGCFSGDTKQLGQALASAQAALTQAQILFSSLKPEDRSPNVAKDLFERMLQLKSEVEKAQQSSSGETKQQLARARSSLTASALLMISDRQGRINLNQLGEEINAGQAAKDTLATIRHLSQVAMLLSDGVQQGLMVGEDQEGGAAATAQLAIAQASQLLSSLQASQVPPSVREELCGAKTRVSLAWVLRPAEQLPTPTALVEATEQLKKEFPEHAEVIAATARQINVPLAVYAPWGKALYSSIAARMATKGSLSDKEWKEMVDTEISAFVKQCPCAVDEGRLKSIVLDEFIARTFQAVEEACQKDPPAPEWFRTIAEAEHVWNAYATNPAKQEAIIERYGPAFSSLVTRLMEGVVVETAFRRPSAAIVEKRQEVDLPGEPGLQRWSTTCASVAIRDTFGRLSAILVEGEKKEPGKRGESGVDRMQKAYDLSQHMVQGLKPRLKERRPQLSDEKIQALVDELMLRCCGDVSVININGMLAVMTGGASIQEEDLSSMRPGFVQLRFSVDDRGNLVAQKIFLLKRRDPMTGQADYIQCTSTMVMDPDASVDAWTERLETERYGAVLAKEVNEEVQKSDRTINEVFEDRKKALEKQVRDPTDRKRIITDMENVLFPKEPKK